MMAPERSGRRGSLKQVTASSSYRDTMKNSILNTVNIEVQGKLVEVQP